MFANLAKSLADLYLLLMKTKKQFYELCVGL